MSLLITQRGSVNKNGTGNNKIRPGDRAVHDWYRFVLAFPPHLVREYLEHFGITGDECVLDPFCGTGTTLVECKKLGIPSVGIEANPMSFFASQAKLNWTADPNGLMRHATDIAARAKRQLCADGLEEFNGLPLLSDARKPKTIRKLAPELDKLLLKNSISPLPLHRTLVLTEVLEEHRDEEFYAHERLALAKTAVATASNLHFGPEVGVRAPKDDAPVVEAWMDALSRTADDLRLWQSAREVPARVCHADARDVDKVLPENSVAAVITSPPYPNEKDYTRTTRLESVLLGLFKSKEELRSFKKTLVRSNTRSVYKDDNDDELVAGHSEIQRIANDIEERRIAMGKTSGWERQYHRVTKLYFGGMARHLAGIRKVLKPGARLAYVVGDQASYLQVMIRTGQLLADIAASLGFVVDDIALFRTRRATATREELREEVVILKWPGAP